MGMGIAKFLLKHTRTLTSTDITIMGEIDWKKKCCGGIQVKNVRPWFTWINHKELKKKNTRKNKLEMTIKPESDGKRRKSWKIPTWIWLKTKPDQNGINIAHSHNGENKRERTRWSRCGIIQRPIERKDNETHLCQYRRVPRQRGWKSKHLYYAIMVISHIICLFRHLIRMGADPSIADKKGF